MGPLHNLHPQSMPARETTIAILQISRRQLAERMASDLIRYEAYANEADAIRSLFGRGYSTIDIAAVVVDAINLAKQYAEFDRQQAAIVAAQMREP